MVPPRDARIKKKRALIDKVIAINWYVMKVKSLTSILIMPIGVKDLKNKQLPPNPKSSNEKVYRGTEQDITEHLVVQTRVGDTKSWSLKKMNKSYNPRHESPKGRN